MVRLVATLMALSAGTGALAADQAADPVVTDPAHYEILLENEHVRVLRYRDMPGDRTRQQDHPRFVLYAVSPFERRIVLPDGRALDRAFEGGEVMWSEAQTHVGENVGDTPTEAIIIELK
jgi:beta-alanine degradation protein BauB